MFSDKEAHAFRAKLKKMVACLMVVAMVFSTFGVLSYSDGKTSKATTTTISRNVFEGSAYNMTANTSDGSETEESAPVPTRRGYKFLGFFTEQ